MGLDHISILIIEKNKEDAFFYKNLLKESPLLNFSCDIIHAFTLAHAMDILSRNPFDLIILDLYLSDSQGLVTFTQLEKVAPNIPIIVITEESDEAMALKVIEKGAQDYLSKDEIHVEFFSRIIRFALERYQQQKLLRELTFTDDLTKIYNRRGFMTLAEQQLELSKRLKQGFSLFLIDLDHLKSINDSFGHPEGDVALIQLVECLKQSFRSSDIIGRIGGDEFAILAFPSSMEHQVLLFTTLRNHIDTFNLETKKPYRLSVSIGCTYFNPEEPLSLIDLIKQADQRLYEEKKRHHTL